MFKQSAFAIDGCLMWPWLDHRWLSTAVIVEVKTMPCYNFNLCWGITLPVIFATVFATQTDVQREVNHGTDLHVTHPDQKSLSHSSPTNPHFLSSKIHVNNWDYVMFVAYLHHDDIISRVPNQNGVSQAWFEGFRPEWCISTILHIMLEIHPSGRKPSNYVVEIHHSGRKHSIY